MRYDLSVISPCFNESQNVVALAERLNKTFEKKNINGEIILVDDASTDDTGRLIDELAGRYPNLKAIHHQRNIGLLSGWRSGLAAASGVYVCLIDSDLQNLPEDVGRLYEEIKFTRADVVQGWRNHVGRLKDSFARHLSSRGLNFLLNFLFGMNLRDNKSAFLVCRKEVLEDILTYRFNYRYPQTFMGVAAKYRGYYLREIETLFQDRLLGKSSLGEFPLKASFLTFIDVIKGLFEYRFFDHPDSSLRNFLRSHRISKKDEPLPFWRNLYFKLYVLLFPFHHWMITRNGASYYQDLKQSQWLGRAELRQYQEQRLRQLMVYAYYHVPFYRELFEKSNLRPEDIRTLEDLKKFPMIDKKTVRENVYLGLLSNNHNKKKIQKVQTTGSTGEPLVTFAEKRQLEMSWAATQRALEWTGYRFGDRQVRLWHKYLGMKRHEIIKEIIDALITRRYFVPAYEITDENLEKYVKHIMSVEPVLLDGYAESYHFLAQYLKNHKYQGHKPKGIMSSGQTLSEHSRKIIEDAFGCRVFDKYGSREFVGGVAYQCPYGSYYHVVDECVIVEVIKDGARAKPGEVGEVVITSLTNFAMPLIRYKIGDLAVAMDPNQVCPCDRGLSLIGEIQGRVQAIMVGTNNQYVPGTFFNRVFFKHDQAIRQYQIVQEKAGELTLKIIKASLFTDNVLSEIMGDIRAHLGKDLKIEVQYVDEIPMTRTGKRQYCISHLDTAEVLSGLSQLQK